MPEHERTFLNGVMQLYRTRCREVAREQANLWEANKERIERDLEAEKNRADNEKKRADDALEREKKKDEEIASLKKKVETIQDGRDKQISKYRAICEGEKKKYKKAEQEIKRLEKRLVDMEREGEDGNMEMTHGEGDSDPGSTSESDISDVDTSLERRKRKSVLGDAKEKKTNTEKEKVKESEGEGSEMRQRKKQKSTGRPNGVRSSSTGIASPISPDLSQLSLSDSEASTTSEGEEEREEKERAKEDGEEEEDEEEEEVEEEEEERKEPTAPRELIPLDRILWKPFFMEDETDETCYYVVQNEDGKTYQWMSHDQLGLVSPLPTRGKHSSTVGNLSTPVTASKVVNAKQWKVCKCRKRKTACRPRSDGHHRGLRTISQCGCDVCGETRFLHVKDKSVYSNLEVKEKKNKNGYKLSSKVCIPENHFIACVTGVVVEGEVKKRDDDVKAGKYHIRQQLDKVKMCEKSNNLFHFLHDLKRTVSDWVMYYKKHNAFLDKNGYIWSLTKIKATEQINITMELGSLLVQFDRYKHQMSLFEADMYFEHFECFGDDERERKYLNVDFILDHPETFPMEVIERYLPKLAQDERFIERWNSRQGGN